MAQNFYQAFNRGDLKTAESIFQNLHQKQHDSPEIQEMQQKLAEKLGYDPLQEIHCKRIAETNDYYEVLGITQASNEEDVKRSYKKLALKFHPDKCKCPSAHEAFKKIGQSFSVLSDKQKREQYDRWGTDTGPQMSYNSEDIDPDEIFRTFFSHMGMNPNLFQQGGGIYTHTFHFGGNHQGQVYNFRISKCLQFLPLFLLFGLTFLSSISQLFVSQIYQFQPSADFPFRRFTRNGVEIYVAKDFHTSYGYQIPEIEKQAELDFIQYLQEQCDFALSRKNQLNQQGGWYGASTRQGQYFLQEAQRVDVTSCNRMNDLKRFHISSSSYF